MFTEILHAFWPPKPVSHLLLLLFRQACIKTGTLLKIHLLLLFLIYK